MNSVNSKPERKQRETTIVNLAYWIILILSMCYLWYTEPTVNQFKIKACYTEIDLNNPTTEKYEANFHTKFIQFYTFYQSIIA